MSAAKGAIRGTPQELAALVESGSVTPIVDKTFAFEDAAEAIRYLEVEHARAKVVIGIS